jgi:hypothetical protein
VKDKKFAGDDPVSFWKNMAFLNIQGGGSSQREMLAMFDEVLYQECGLEVAGYGDDPKTFLYLDDGIFSGNRVRNDLIGWIESDAPAQATVRVVVIAFHCGGQYYASTSIKKAAREANKQIEMSWWRCVEIEDRKKYINTSEVLRPASLSGDDLMTAYEKMLKDSGYLRSCAKQGRWVIARFFHRKWGGTCWNSNSCGLAFRSGRCARI